MPPSRGWPLLAAADARTGRIDAPSRPRAGRAGCPERGGPRLPCVGGCEGVGCARFVNGRRGAWLGSMHLYTRGARYATVARCPLFMTSGSEPCSQTRVRWQAADAG